MPELILALDRPSREEVLGILDRLPAVRWVKVGSVLMTAQGPGLVRELVGRGLQVFLDLKWHDIPTTVAEAVSVATGLGVRLATVHTVGGETMLRAATAAAGDQLSLVGVTVLTSQPGSSAADSGAGLGPEVERLARLAMDSGLAGVVCSALEIERVRAVLGPPALIVVPGIRRLGDSPDDQRRTGSPSSAARAGATHLVIGRTVLQASDPAAAWAAIRAEVDGPDEAPKSLAR